MSEKDAAYDGIGSTYDDPYYYEEEYYYEDPYYYAVSPGEYENDW